MGKIVTIKENAIFINKVSGEIEVEDLVTYLKNNAPDWKKNPTIWDYTEADMAKLSGKEWDSFVKKIRPLVESRSGAKVALVGSRDLQFGLLRVLNAWIEIHKSSIKIKVFRDIEKAKEWITSPQD